MSYLLSQKNERNSLKIVSKLGHECSNWKQISLSQPYKMYSRQNILYEITKKKQKKILKKHQKNKLSKITLNKTLL